MRARHDHEGVDRCQVGIGCRTQPGLIFSRLWPWTINHKKQRPFRSIKEAIKRGPYDDNLKEALVCLASSFRGIGKLRSAVEYIKIAKRKFPDDLGGYQQLLARYYNRMRRQKNN